MKKLLVVCVLALGALTVKAQDANPNVIKVNPLGLLFGSANVTYERALNPNSSVMVGGQFGGFKLGEAKYSSYGALAQYRFYFGASTSAPEGFYAAPAFQFNKGKVTVDYTDIGGSKEETNYGSIGGGIMVGKQWIYGSGFVMDLGVGAMYQKFNYDDENSSFGFKGSGMMPAISFAIGYNF